MTAFIDPDAMSLQVNLSGRELAKAYQDVLNANGVDWALFTYEKGTNDLRLQATGDGGLEELEEEFSDGRCVDLPASCTIESINVDIYSRIQYAFVRVKDPNVS